MAQSLMTLLYLNVYTRQLLLETQLEYATVIWESSSVGVLSFFFLTLSLQGRRMINIIPFYIN